MDNEINIPGYGIVERYGLPSCGLLRVRRHGYVGYINPENLEIVIPIIYHKSTNFTRMDIHNNYHYNSRTQKYISYAVISLEKDVNFHSANSDKGRNYGVIDVKGRYMIIPIYENGLVNSYQSNDFYMFIGDSRDMLYMTCEGFIIDKN